MASASLLARYLLERASLARAERLTPDGLAALRARRLREVRGFAAARSPFYAQRHAGLAKAPLADLPVVTKSQLMAHFDDVVTDRRITLAGLIGHVERLRASAGDPSRPWAGRWWTAATAWSTGEPAILAWDEAEWATVMASYTRATRWAGLRVGPGNPLRLAIVSTLVPTHQSAVVGATARAPFVRTLRLDAGAPREHLVTALNDFSPRLLVGYASALRGLATAQLDGRLRIHPKVVMSASEVLSSATAVLMRSAWGREPIDVYAATETAGIASMCTAGSRHVYDDLLVVEPVDAADQPVAPGVASVRTLVTVLFARTLPLIRYALSDRLMLVEGRCPCGLPFPLIGPIGGRAEDTVTVPTEAGEVGVDAEILRPVIEAFPVDSWRAQAGPRGLEVLLVPEHQFETEGLTERLRRVLEPYGEPPVSVSVVPELPRTPLGKSRPVRRPA